MYNVLTSMNFFKNYLIGKVFRLWKGNVRYRMYKRTRQDLAKQLIFTRPDFLPKYMEINKLLFEMQFKSQVKNLCILDKMPQSRLQAGNM